MANDDMQAVIRQLRAATAEQLTSATLDVLVVGGGIVGAGVARDAAMRGLRVGLVEQNDLASGTSSRSSRLLHGGLRYLAQGRVGLVYEASHEKSVLRRIAPHLVQPLPFVFPAYRRTTWPLWQLRIGVKLYDLLCGGYNFDRSSSLSVAQLASHLPGIKTTDLTGGVRYFDALTNDARLVIDTLLSAKHYRGIISNYTQLENASPHGQVWRCQVRDVIAGHAYDVTARCVVNATGPWAQTIPHSRVRLRLTKGIHLVVDRGRLPVPDAVVMTEAGRILFAIPWGERVILGTTDTDYDGPLEDPQAEPGDVAYILRVVNEAFPSAALGEADVISRWAGLRPLIDTGRGGPSDISRAHQIAMPEPGWLDVAGGKLTTYRLIAQQAVDRLVAYLDVRAAPCRTADEPLVPVGSATRTAESSILPPEVSRELVDHYCRHQWAVHPDDVMLRRTSWRHYRKDADTVAEQVAVWMGIIR